MTRTTPAEESSTRFSCPNPHCVRFNRLGEGNIAHRSWTGTHQHIERLRCTACGREFSEREGPLMARSKLRGRVSAVHFATLHVMLRPPAARERESIMPG